MLEVAVGLLVFSALLVAGAWVLGDLVARYFIRATADLLDAVASARQG